MIRNVLEQIGGIGLYGIIALLLFASVFAGMLLWVLRMKPPYLNSMRQLPLSGDTPALSEGDHHHDGP